MNGYIHDCRPETLHEYTEREADDARRGERIARRYAADVEYTTARLNEDICGLCGQPGADKVPHPVHWPGEDVSGTELVHDECESEECRRAHAALTDRQREEFLRTL